MSLALTRRAARTLAVVVGLLAALGLVARLRSGARQRPHSDDRLPPLYDSARAREMSLPHYRLYQHAHVRFFCAANHATSSGWGNVMQDFVMMALLAHETNRSFVFNDYVWNPDGSLYSEYNARKIPSRIPLSALVAGPMVGGRWPPGDVTPLSVSREFFHRACPSPTIIQVSDVNTDEMRFSDHVSSARMFESWVHKINSIDDPCIMLDPDNDPIFEYWIFGNKERLLSIWPYLARSPVSTHWAWSPLVHDAYNRNRHVFESSRSSLVDLFFRSKDRPMPDSIPGLLAIHVRRGDFENHCAHLARWSADWNAFNSFPEFRDKFDRPTDAGGGETTEANMQLYMRRCYPSIEQIVEKVARVRTESAHPLRYLYILTNGQTPWVEELKTALAQDMSWDRVGSSRDLDLTWEEKFVSQALDMSVAERAQVFIGNGWSSLTSNVVMLRVAHGVDPDTNRFW